MCCVVLDVLHLHPDHCAGRAAVVVVIRVADRKEVWREGGIEQESKGNKESGIRDWEGGLAGNLSPIIEIKLTKSSFRPENRIGKRFLPFRRDDAGPESMDT